MQIIRRRLRVLQATDFYKLLSAKKPVHPPIQKTNLLIKNVDYNNCYKLWLYISSFTYLGYTFEIMDKNLPVDSDYYDDLTIIAGLGAQSLVNDNVVKKDNYRDVQFVRPQEKEYNLVTNLSFKPEFDSSKAQAGEEAINEYYFRKMKDELVKLTQENDVVIDKQINVNFSKFYRAIARINDELYNDLIEEQIKADDDSIIRLPIVKKQDEIKRQQERLKRRNLLLKLKWEEVERAQRVQERAQAKLDKLKKELEAEKQKVKDKKVKKGVIRTKTVVKVSRPKKVTLVDNDKKGE
jgi:hypothetical protein